MNHEWINKRTDRQIDGWIGRQMDRWGNTIFLGHKFYSGEDNSFSLRRKLFGQPQRSSCHDNYSYRDSNEDVPESPDTQYVIN